MGGAHTAVRNALDSGRLLAPSACEACGQLQRQTEGGRPWVVLHHWSYARECWLDVIPLCYSCHRRVHSGLMAEPRTGRFYARHSGPAGISAETVRDLLARVPEPFRWVAIPGVPSQRVAVLTRARKLGWIRRLGSCKGSTWVRSAAFPSMNQAL